jgi:hypothetical protein
MARHKPTHPSLYRPKRVRWAQKLASLCREGWTLEEMKVWTKTHWYT